MPLVDVASAGSDLVRFVNFTRLIASQLSFRESLELMLVSSHMERANFDSKNLNKDHLATRFQIKLAFMLFNEPWTDL